MGVAKKTTFSIADSADSWVTVSRDLIEYSGSGIVNISITPIFSQNMPSFYWAKYTSILDLYATINSTIRHKISGKDIPKLLLPLFLFLYL